jgi:hypothetical protein
MTVLATVATDDNARLLAIGSLVTFLTAVAASHRLRWIVRTVAAEVAHLAAALALDVVGVARLWALLRIVARLLAVAAEVRIDAFLCAIASTMAGLVADVAGDNNTTSWLDLLFPAVLANMPHLAAVAALGHETIHGKAAVLETLEVLFLGIWPAFGKLLTSRLVAELEGENILLVDGAVEANDGHGIRDLTLLPHVSCNRHGYWRATYLCDEVEVAVIITEALLHICQVNAGIGTAFTTVFGLLSEHRLRISKHCRFEDIDIPVRVG